MPSLSLTLRLSAVTAAIMVARPALANDDTECGVWSVNQGDLVECANPNDSPGPYTPPTFTLLVQQDDTGVTAVLDDGTTIDVDVASDGSLEYAVDGEVTSAGSVEQALDSVLTEDEQAAVSAALTGASETEATDELIVLLDN